MSDESAESDRQSHVSWIHRIKYLAYCGIIMLCNCLPQRFLYWVALRLSDLQWLCDRRGREAVKSNLRQMLPGATEDRIWYESRWVFRNFGKYMSEFFRFRRMGPKFFERHVAFRGGENVERALELGRGAVLVSAHLSNWELGGAAARWHFNTPVNVVILRHTYKKADELFQRERAAQGINCIPVERAPLHVLRHLKKNEIVCVLGDRDPSGQGVLVDFFGRKCRFPQGPARFALTGGAPILPCFVTRRSNDSFLAWCMPPIPIPQEGTRDEKIHAVTQAYAHEFEAMIRWHPEEWATFYRFWDEEWIQ